MKPAQILSALGLPNYKENKAHCSKLAKVFSFLVDIKPHILLSEIVAANITLMFGRNTEQKFKGVNQETKLPVWEEVVNNSGQKILASKIKVTTKTGEYSFAIPTGNAFYNAVCDLLGIAYGLLPVPVEPAISTILVPGDILESIGRAIKFVSKDDLRPVMQHVCIDAENCKVEVVATDAHKLYRSQAFESSQVERVQLLISVENAKKIAALTTYPGETLELRILPGNRLQIDDFICDTFEGIFPQYRVVIPEYSNFMRFDRANVMHTIKTVLPAANRCTHMVSFHLNGDITASACEVDFAYETTSRMNYLEKTFPDADISFNGKFLIECLKTFKDKELKMYSDGHPKKAVLWSNDIESILLMPLCNGL